MQTTGVEPQLCAGCGEPLPPAKSGRGRPSLFHGGACRTRDYRRRHQPAAASLRSEALALAPELLLPLAYVEAVEALDEELLPEVARLAQTARAALSRLAELTGSARFPLDQPAPLPVSVTPPAVTETVRPLAPVPVAAPAPRTAMVPRAAVAGLHPTEEQGAIMDGCAAGLDLVVEAGAGTGKTTTLRLAASGMKGRGLYVAYNRAIAQDAKRQFPKHVQCSTAHSLAYQVVGRDYRGRLNLHVPARREAELLRIVEPLRVSRDLVLAPAQLARLASEAVDAFAHSADDEVKARHVPALDGVEASEMEALRREVLPHARSLWERTQAVDAQHRYTHDYYLKAWALTRPKLAADFILLDEAQDSNPVVAQLVQAQQCQRIAVGDSAQAIYGWRGAVDALATWPAQQRLYLQQSWRFGQAIAAEANLWLDQIKAPIRLQGNPGKNSRVVQSGTGSPDAVLCRTNAETMARAMSALDQGLRPALVGGGKQIRALAEAAVDLQAGRPASHPDLIAFSNWDQLREYVSNEAAGSDLKTFVRLIDDHGPQAVIKAANSLVEESAAHVILSTAHKAKGREWDSVEIARDFSAPKDDEQGNPGPIRRTDAMLAYVAVTRAKQLLDRQGLAWISRYSTEGVR